MDRWRVRREHRNRTGRQQGLTGGRGRHLGCCHLRGWNHRHGFPDARLLAGVRVLLGRLECGLRRLQHVRHQNRLRRGHVLLARVGALLLHQHRSRRLRRMRARRRVTRWIRCAGASWRERFGGRIQREGFLWWYLRGTAIGSSGTGHAAAVVHHRSVLTLVGAVDVDADAGAARIATGRSVHDRSIATVVHRGGNLLLLLRG